MTRVTGRPITFDQLFETATGRTRYDWQRDLALRHEPARVVVAATGAGKTEAVTLDWLWRRRFQPDTEQRRQTPRRLVLALPMRVLVEQTHDRLQEMLRRLTEAGLLEPLKVYGLVGGAADDSWTLDPAADAVLVGTIDMLISRALNRGFGRGRARWPIDFGLLNSDCLWVFDEIQLMDAAVATSAQLQAFRMQLETAAPSRTVWMSATLHPGWLETRDHPVPSKAAFATLGKADHAGPLGKRLQAEKSLVRESIALDDPAEIAEIVLREHGGVLERDESPCLTITICNTVERAVAIYEALLRRIDGDADLLLLHSRFRPLDRKHRVGSLFEECPAEGRIVVSTQVVEAGIDLDAGALVTELAPWASLVQRAGRLNREGKRRETRMVWLDPGDEAIAKRAAPYESKELEAARSALRECEGRSFSPEALETFMTARPQRQNELLGSRPLSVLLRLPDLIDLFDTDATLDGDDPDIGRFIRADDDLDVGVAWRPLSEKGPTLGDPLPRHDEVCPVPLSKRKELAALSPWRWNYALRRWEKAVERNIRPGDLLLLDSDAGGYDPFRGWTGKTGRVEPIHADGTVVDPSDSDAADPESAHPKGRWISLVEHTEHVVSEVERIIAGLDLSTEWAASLRVAARAHDAGKGHEEFQRRLREWAGETSPWPGVWAKAPGNVKKRFPAFRHELVSALLLLDRHDWSRDLDLVAYLIAAHHGKLRLTPRVLPDDHDPQAAICLGVREGARVDEVDVGGGERFGPLEIDLAVLRIGSLDGATWIERTLDLCDRLGPFRLGYLEALLRAADQRASAEETKTT